jgi:hypothetical protein
MKTSCGFRSNRDTDAVPAPIFGLLAAREQAMIGPGTGSISAIGLPRRLAAAKTSKYRNRRTLYNGITYDSKKEAAFAQELDLMMHARGRERVESWERQIRFPLSVNGRKICDHVCDFLVRYADGRKELVEVKGRWTPEARVKRKLFEATFLADQPDIRYRIA